MGNGESNRHEKKVDHLHNNEIISIEVVMKWYFYVIIVVFLLLIGLYFFKFSGGLSNNQFVWGSFGDYVTGILTIFLVLISLYFGLNTFKQGISALEKDKQVNKLNMLYFPLLKDISDFHNIILLSANDAPPRDLPIYGLTFKWAYITNAYSFILNPLVSRDEKLIVQYELRLLDELFNFYNISKNFRSEDKFIKDAQKKTLKSFIKFYEKDISDVKDNLTQISEKITDIDIEYTEKMVTQAESFIVIIKTKMESLEKNQNINLDKDFSALPNTVDIDKLLCIFDKIKSGISSEILKIWRDKIE